jgi:hypothetical protein
VPSSTSYGARAAALVAVVVLVLIAVWAFGGGARPQPASSGPGVTSIPAGTPLAPAGSPTETPAGPSPSMNASPQPPRSSGAPVAVLVGAGDIADCASGGDEKTADLLDTLAGTVFTLGDNVYENGTADEFKRCYAPTWGRHRARTLPVPGNHDYNMPGASGYFGYFGAAAGDPARGYYAYERGAWRVYVLNSNCAAIGGCDAGSRQERWLRDDLAANPRACVLAMWHHPLFSSGEHGSDPLTHDLWRALYTADADLVLNGHDHDYERFAPQTPSGRADPDQGIVEIVAGTGGRSHYDFPNIRANSVVRNNTTYGVLRLELSDGEWTYKFVPVAGGPFTDSGSGTCH